MGIATVDCLIGSVRLLEGRAEARIAIGDAVAVRRGEADRIEQSTADPGGRAQRQLFGLLMLRELPSDFDPADDKSVAEWAIAYRRAAYQSHALFVMACVRRIHQDRPAKL